jgi:MFS family permease
VDVNEPVESSDQGVAREDAGAGLGSLLRIADFRRLWICDGLMFQGLWMEGLVVGWLVLEMTDSPFWVAMVDFCRAIPIPFAGLFGPVLTDRFQRRRVILALQTLNALALITVAVLYWSDGLKYWHLAAAAAVGGIAWGLDWPNRRAFIPDLVGKSRVVDGMLLGNGMQAFARVSGPLLGGVALAAVGVGGALVIMVAMAVLSVLVLTTIRSEARSPDVPRGISSSLSRVAEGLRYVRGQRVILGIVAVTVIMNVWAFPYQSLLPVFARDVLGRGPLGLGLLTCASGLGSFLGLLLVTRYRHDPRRVRIFAGGSVLCCLGLVGFASCDYFPLAVLMLLVVGVGQAGFSSMQSTILLMEAPDHIRNRVMGTLVCAIGMGPFGRIQAGSLATLSGAPVAVAAMAGFAVVAMCVAIILLPGFVRPRPISSR